MIPVRDDIPTRTFPFFTILFIIINAAVFLFQVTLTDKGSWIFIHRFGTIPAALIHFSDPFPNDHLSVFITPVTGLFLHGGFIHLAGNMLFLWIFGNNIEDILGHIRFVIFYLLCGFMATGLHILTEPNSVIPLVGASGAIAGIMGAYLILYPRARILTMILIVIYPVFVWIPAVFFLVIWFLFQVLNATGSASGNVAWAAHVGGFITGIVAIRLWIGSRRKRLRQPPGSVPRAGGNVRPFRRLH
jgi:hypothetical protein